MSCVRMINAANEVVKWFKKDKSEESTGETVKICDSFELLSEFYNRTQDSAKVCSKISPVIHGLQFSAIPSELAALILPWFPTGCCKLLPWRHSL